MMAKKPRFKKAAVATMRLVMEIMAPATADAIFTTNAAIEDIIFAKDVVMARAIVWRLFCKEVTTAVMKFIKPVITEATSFTVKDRIFEKNAVIEVRIVRIPVLMETMALVTADITLVTNVAMRWTIARKPAFREVAIEIMRFASKERTLEKNVIIEAGIFSKAVMMADMAFVMA